MTDPSDSPSGNRASDANDNREPGSPEKRFVAPASEPGKPDQADRIRVSLVVRTLLHTVWERNRWSACILLASLLIAGGRLVWTGYHGMGVMDTLAFGTPWMGVWLSLFGAWTIIGGDWSAIRAIARKRALDEHAKSLSEPSH